ncbi:potassium-transporting ATPase subunit C [Skermania sp. ID1734]|uniref:potassium-transporting ATPase subunit C n=1 Tax=Skermania sp. ID1734 TaxID=2597516 RepID=UPI00117FB7B0|nr:potassium-transporting ATPase subunit C [Skermania sp. ID1734]TSD97270.1 potassium-transporting ATPase subunit C [Skermania sp. ID1734]
MFITSLFRQHLAALRALLVLTVVTGAAYPLAVWGLAQIPGLRDKADGSIIDVSGRPVGSELIGQPFVDANGSPLRQYFQSRPSYAGTGYDPTNSGAGNLGPESIVDTPGDPVKLDHGAKPADAGFKPSLLTTVCANSFAIGELESVDGRRPYCTANGVGAVLSLIGPRDARGNVTRPIRVVSVNEPCSSDPRKPTATFIAAWAGVKVECARYGEDYAAGQIIPVRGDAPAISPIPPDAITASGSGLDPDISSAYARLQVSRIASARSITTQQVLGVLADNTHNRTLGFLGEPTVNVLQANLELDRKYPVRS